MQKLQYYYNRILKWLLGEVAYSKTLVTTSNRFAISLNLLAGLVGLFYMLSDLIRDFRLFHPIHLSVITASVIGFLLFRMQKVELAKSIVLFILMIAVFMAASAANYSTGSHLYFITLMIASFVVFDYQRWKTGLFFATVAFALYMFTVLSDFSVLEETDYSTWSTQTYFVINVTIFAISTSVIVMLYIMMIHRKNLKILKQQRELEHANSELDHFLHMTSHDLRAPLASVSGLIDLTEEAASKYEITQYLTFMRNSVDKMDDSISDILSVIRASRMPVRTELVNLRKLAERVFSDLKYRSGGSQIQFTNQIPDSLEINSDKLRVQTVISNLLSNAIKYSDHTKENRFVEISGASNGKMVHLCVRDNGIGIPEDQISRIFNMFHRVSNDVEGTGLGLYIANETILKLNGEIEVDSQLGSGTTFRILLPKN